MEIVSCPGCDAHDFVTIGRPSGEVPVQLGGRRFVQPKFSMRCCRNCGLYYKSHALDWPELETYYALTDAAKWEIPGLYPTERATLRLLSRLKPQSSILDYGCSTGRLLDRLTGQRRFGVEINDSAARIAAQKGITILNDEDLARGEYRFDAIVLADVFEHLPRPTQTLEKLFGLLNPNGMLVLSTGNADAPACQRDPAHFWYLSNIEHLIMISRGYAEFLAGKLGARLASWELLPHYDWSFHEKIRMEIQDFAYWSYHDPKRAKWVWLVNLIPVLRRAKKWPIPPAYPCSNDHVVAAWIKGQ
ncbi:MAG: class I SAM-dependent methyltransferase [Phycisphaeraceae bacterium]|nr:class I SAM-dependent methyltransferase [Phycisphaeraceae bacterium]